jgi:hypothetical protein
MMQALLTPQPPRIQRAVDTATISGILLSASMVGFTAGLVASLTVAALLAPVLWLRKAFRTAPCP